MGPEPGGLGVWAQGGAVGTESRAPGSSCLVPAFWVHCSSAYHLLASRGTVNTLSLNFLLCAAEPKMLTYSWRCSSVEEQLPSMPEALGPVKGYKVGASSDKLSEIPNMYHLQQKEDGFV